MALFCSIRLRCSLFFVFPSTFSTSLPATLVFETAHPQLHACIARVMILFSVLLLSLFKTTLAVLHIQLAESYVTTVLSVSLAHGPP